MFMPTAIEPSTAHYILQWYINNMLLNRVKVMPSGICIVGMSMMETLLTLGREALDPELWVVMVSTVVMPKPTRAGAASMLIQKDTQDKMTIRRLGMYIWIR